MPYTGSTCNSRLTDEPQLHPDPWFSNSWEFVLSLDFDWQFISGKKKFRWPLVRFVGTRNQPCLFLIAH